MEYHSSNHWVYSCKYHLIFTTKYRRKVLNEEMQMLCKNVLLSLQDETFKIIELEVMQDHVHILFECGPERDLAGLIFKLKGISSKILREKFPSLKSKLPSLWTRSKFISTVGSVSLEVVKSYIENQKWKPNK